MEKTNFWKDVAKYGAIIGALLAVSFMLETRLQISASFGLYAIEWIAVVVLHYYLLHRFTRRYSMMYTAEEGFSFGQGYAYILSVFFKNPVGRNFREYSVRCRFRPYHCRHVVACAQTVRYPAKRIGTYRE